jgi:hypothetical protein
MPEGIGGEGTQGGNPETGTQGAPPQQGAPEGAQGTGAPDGEQQSRSDDSAAVIARLNAEAKKHREAYEAAAKELSELKQAGMSELEKTQTKLAEEERRRMEVENKLQELTLGEAVRTAATKAKAVDADLVWRAVDLGRVEYDADGKPTNLDALVAEVKKAHPILFGQARGDADGGSRGSTGPSGDMNELIRRGARRAPV